MITLKSTKIKNIILFASILFVSSYPSPPTILRKDNEHLVFNIKNLNAIGYIKIDEGIKNELLNSFHGVNIQAGNDILRRFFNLFLILLLDKAIGNGTNFFREDNSLSVALLNEDQGYNVLKEEFYSTIMLENNIVTMDQFLIEFMGDQEDYSEDIVSLLRILNYNYGLLLELTRPSVRLH